MENACQKDLIGQIQRNDGRSWVEMLQERKCHRWETRAIIIEEINHLKKKLTKSIVFIDDEIKAASKSWSNFLINKLLGKSQSLHLGDKQRPNHTLGRPAPKKKKTLSLTIEMTKAFD